MGAMVNLDGVTAYRAEPMVPPRGGLILIHEIWGLVPHIRDVADRYAREGYLVIAPDLLSDAGITPEVGAELAALLRESDENKRLEGQTLLREKLASTQEPVFAAEAVRKLRLVVDALDAEPGIDERIAVTGFCFGGTYSFELAAADSRVRAAIPFYGIAPDAEAIARIACPVLALYGEDDPRVMATLPETRKNMADAGVAFTEKVYAGARHAFFNDTNASSYDAGVAGDAWARSLAFLATHLGKALPSEA
ncbi:MAG TPA: dienelactone hydrolase family protein [Pseudolysinimonas sp.]|nr:dienelactone hydrolase family protein [Pseudolysinimonas sp.]